MSPFRHISFGTKLRECLRLLGLCQLRLRHFSSKWRTNPSDKTMNLDRQSNIELLAGYKDKLDELKMLLGQSYTQLELDTALENAIAYSRIDTADYLLTLGARFENHNYQGVYYAVHNNELEGLKYAISKGVDINLNEGQLLRTSIITTINSKDLTLIKWLLENGASVKYLNHEHFELIDRYGTKEFKELIKTI